MAIVVRLPVAYLVVMKLTTEMLDNLGNGSDNTISSLGPDQGTTCRVWEYVTPLFHLSLHGILVPFLLGRASI